MLLDPKCSTIFTSVHLFLPLSLGNYILGETASKLLVQVVKKFMEPEGSLRFTQKLVNESFYGPGKSHPRPPSPCVYLRST